MARSSGWRSAVVISALLLALTAAVFWPVLTADFVSYDDPVYVSTNPHVSTGLTWENVKWSFTSGYAQNWFPLTWITHMLDVQFFGMRPGLHHLTNLLLHCANVVLLFFVLRRMTRATWASVLVAALFGVHPLHVESVAWVAERKDVLSTFFGLLSLWAYAVYADCRTQRGGTLNPQRSTVNRSEAQHSLRRILLSKWYWVALLLFGCSLMSKPMWVTMPCLLLLLDFWPLNRIGNLTEGNEGNPNHERSSLSSLASVKGLPFFIRHSAFLILEKLPFLALTIASSLITMHVQTDAMVDPNALPLASRLQNAVLTYGHYLAQTFWPAKLAIFYPYPTEFSTALVGGILLVFIAVTGLVFWQAQRFPFALVGWFWFLGMLVPTVGIVQVGAQSRADRYTYMPLVGIFVLVTWTVWKVFSLQYAAFRSRTASTDAPPVSRSRSTGLVILAAVAVACVVNLAAVAHRQATFWQSSEAVFRHAAQVTDDNYVAVGGLGIVELQHKNPEAALTNLMTALKSAERHGAASGTKYYIGIAYQMLGKPAEALPWLEESKAVPEQAPDREHRIGLALLDANRIDEAEPYLTRAAQARPDRAEFDVGLAALSQKRGDTNHAAQFLEAAVKKDPKMFAAQRGLADVLLDSGHPQEALPHYAAAMELQSPDAHLLEKYGDALAASGRMPDALQQMEKAAQLAPTNALIKMKLAQFFSDSGQTARAVAVYKEAINQDPKLVGALNDLAWVLATDPDEKIRNGREAVEFAHRACEQTDWKVPIFIGTLAAAYAEAGDFTEAVLKAEKARDGAQDQKQDQIAKRNAELLEIYRAKKAYHEPARKL